MRHPCGSVNLASCETGSPALIYGAVSQGGTHLIEAADIEDQVRLGHQEDFQVGGVLPSEQLASGREAYCSAK